MKMPLKMSSAKWWPFCPGGDELIDLTLYNVSSQDVDTFSQCLGHPSIWSPCSGIAWVDIPEFAPLRRSWIHMISFLEELERSASVSMGSPLNSRHVRPGSELSMFCLIVFRRHVRRLHTYWIGSPMWCKLTIIPRYMPRNIPYFLALSVFGAVWHMYRLSETVQNMNTWRHRDVITTVIIHACFEFYVWFWDCPFVGYYDFNRILLIHHHLSPNGVFANYIPCTTCR